MHLMGGWYDIFLPWMLEDFAALQAAGHAPQLMIGPWTHSSPELLGAGIREGIAWLRARLLGDDRLVRPARVRCSSPASGSATGGASSRLAASGRRAAADLARRRRQPRARWAERIGRCGPLPL